LKLVETHCLEGVTLGSHLGTFENLTKSLEKSSWRDLLDVGREIRWLRSLATKYTKTRRCLPPILKGLSGTRQEKGSTKNTSFFAAPLVNTITSLIPQFLHKFEKK